MKRYSIAIREHLWTIRESGTSDIIKTFKRKEKAIDWARKNLNNSTLYIHCKDWTVERKVYTWD